MLFALIFICAAFMAAFLYMDLKERHLAAVILKGLASVCFVLMGIMNSPGGTAANYILYGLIFGCAADVVIDLRFIFKEKKKLPFMAGVVIFLLGHLAYLMAVITVSSHFVAFILAGIIPTAIVLIIMFKHITVSPAFFTAGIVYLGVIMMLNSVSIGNLIASPSRFTAVFAVGAFLFMISDIVLIINNFGRKYRKGCKVANIIMYYTGQVLIASSLLFL
ncbi:MAG: lysoplasmalogenase [Lachnospiraceae bacterium]|nr:lysoplasmalogenase [Lachnospiraceae bacterium]